MPVILQPLSPKERAELTTYISMGVTIGRVLAFICAVSLIGFCLWLASGRSKDPRYWLSATSLAALWLYWYGKKWTGGTQLRNQIRADLQSNTAGVHVIEVADVIEIDECEDEGPGFFIKTQDDKVLAMSGQFLIPYVDKGFPWRSFQIREGAQCRIFLGIKKAGESLSPVEKRPPLSWDELKTLGLTSVNWTYLDVEFESLKVQIPQVISAGG